MRSRNIKPGFFENEHLGKMPFQVRLLFEGLWCIADREGRLEDRPLKIKAKIFPYDRFMDDDEAWIQDLLNTLEQSPGNFICRYSVNGSRYIQILNFKNHQKPHVKESQSKIPAPPKKDESHDNFNQTEFQKEAQPGCDLGTTKVQPGCDLGSAIDKPRQPDSLIPDSLELSKESSKAASSSKHFSNKIDKGYLEPLLDIAKKIQGKSNGTKAFNPYAWIQRHQRKQSHPGAMLQALQALCEYWETVKDATAYLEGIMKSEHQNFNEKDAIKAHEKLKAEFQAWQRSPEGQKVTKLYRPRAP